MDKCSTIILSFSSIAGKTSAFRFDHLNNIDSLCVSPIILLTQGVYNMRRLGLDIGTNSIGWCLIENDFRIIGIGVRIFADGRNPKGVSLAEDRRIARGMRRRRDRYLRRRTVFLDTLIAYGLMPENANEARLIAAHDPYILRLRALDEPLTPHEIGRALFHLNQRRGFKSNRKADRKQNKAEEGEIALGAQRLDAAMQAVGARTLGEFLAGQHTKRVRMGSDNQSYDFYPQRRHLEAEFAAIWSAQSACHPALLTEDARAALHRVLFFQRPLKDQEVGYCTFAGMNGVPMDERRLPKAHPLFQQRRLYEEVNQLRIVAPGAADRPLTIDERDKLIMKLRDQKKMSFRSMAKLIKLGDGERFNKESETRKDLIGDEVRAELAAAKRFGSRWSHFKLDEQVQIITQLQNEEDPQKLRDWLQASYGLDDTAIGEIANASLPEGYGRFGITATTLLLAALQVDVITYDKAAQAAGFHHSDHRTGEILNDLPYYGEILTREISPGKAEYGDEAERRFGKITNPTVHIGLRQLQKLINELIAVYGRPDQIVVELARDLNLSEEDKKQHLARIKRDTDAAITRGEKLREASIPDTGANRALLKCWEALNPDNPLDRRCPYCATPISMRQLFSGEVDIDHIIPYSRSLDDSTGNKIVAHRACNREKGNKTPFEKWGHDEARWELISAQAARLNKTMQKGFAPDAAERLEKDEKFLARQLTDTQYLSRMTHRYLSYLYADSDMGSVYVIPGRMTAMLRRRWGLNQLLPDHNYVDNAQSGAPKNRLDHRHHAIDAAVTAVTTRSLLQKISSAAKHAEALELERMVPPQPWEGFREELRQKLSGITVSHKPDHGRRKSPARGRDVTAGRLHMETAYGLTGETAADGKTPIVVHRVPFLSLKPKDIADPLCLPDFALREALRAATGQLTGKAFEQALAAFAKNHPLFMGIRHVRVREPLTVIPIHDKTGLAYKAYKGGSNARYNVWRLPDGTWQHEVVSTFDAHQAGHQDSRPHPAAKKILCLRQNDLVAIERNGGTPEIMRVVKFTLKGQITLAGHTEGGALTDRDKSPNDPFKLYSPTASGLQKLKARQVRVDPIGRVFDPGPRG